MHYTAFVPYSVTAGCSLTSQHSRSTACALLSDHGYLLIQAFFQALQSYSWGFALIQFLSIPAMNLRTVQRSNIIKPSNLRRHRTRLPSPENSPDDPNMPDIRSRCMIAYCMLTSKNSVVHQSLCPYFTLLQTGKFRYVPNSPDVYHSTVRRERKCSQCSIPEAKT